MATDAQLDLLKRHNPFASSSVGDPWDRHYPHVPVINERVFHGICQLIIQKTHDPALNCAALILGEVGSGKTHLLGRILAHTTHLHPPCTFAYVQPIEDAEQPYRYLLREVMVNLCRATPQAAPYTTQLEGILAAICVEVLQQHSRPTGQQKLHTMLGERLNIFAYIRPAVFAYAQKWASELLCRTYPDLSARFLDVLFQYRLPEQRAAAVNWLKGGGLDQSDAESLGVSERFQVSAARLEQEARDMLTSLGLLLARYRQPLLLCFDRLENLESQAQLHAFGKMLEFLVDTAKGMLPIACVRGQQWEEKFRRVLNQHVTSRLETNRFTLQGCTVEQALALVRSRLASVLEAEPAEALFPFDAEELRRMFQTGFHSPRSVIARVNARLRHVLDIDVALPVSPLQTLQEAFDRQHQTIVQEFDRYPPDRDRLRRALGLYLNHTPLQYRWRLESVQRPDTELKYVDLIATLQSFGAPPTSVAMLIDIELHPATVSASLTRGIDFLQAHTSSIVVYLRDARCPFPSPPNWKTTNDKLQRFRTLGGQVIFLNREHAAAWYALTLLSYAIREGDVTLVDTEQKLRTVSPDEFVAFVRQAFYGDASPAFRELEAVLGKRGNATPSPVPSSLP